ncbi:MAG TPA: hypothetical protein VEW42_04435 [Candidatus Eisenbacteria bacterium]|nr:hypothetical protein [Candidatus Eisenbacteria bacterium]
MAEKKQGSGNSKIGWDGGDRVYVLDDNGVIEKRINPFQPGPDGNKPMEIPLDAYDRRLQAQDVERQANQKPKRRSLLSRWSKKR